MLKLVADLNTPVHSYAPSNWASFDLERRLCPCGGLVIGTSGERSHKLEINTGNNSFLFFLQCFDIGKAMLQHPAA